MPIKKPDDIVDPLMQQLRPLLKNIQDGVASFGVEGFNSKLVEILNATDGKDTVINTVFDVICEEFSVTKRQLLSTHAKNKIKEAKYTCACILHFHFGVTIRMIGRYAFKNKQFGFVWLAIKRHKGLNVKIKSDKEYKDRFDKVFSKVKQTLTEVKQ